jgi:hypothetical protein
LVVALDVDRTTNATTLDPDFEADFNQIGDMALAQHFAARLAERFAIYHAGKGSATDPKFTTGA